MMSKLSGLVFLCVLALPIPAAWSDEAPSASPAATTEAPAASTPAAATAAAPTEPTLMAADKISAGDTAWMLTSTALVLMMSIPGLALFYGGMVRKKNVLATLMQTFAITCLVTLLWWLIGYSWAFTPGSPFLGGASRAFFNGMTFIHDPTNRLSVSHLALTIPETVYAMFQLTFAAITPALIAGAFADRMKFSAMLVFMAAWSLLVYSPIAHMVWEPTGWLNKAGVLDYAGGTVGAADGRAGMAMLATQLATAAAALAWASAEWISRGKPSVLGIASGAVAGLVAITPASGFVGPTPAVIIGIVAGAVCFIAATSLKHALGYDDSLDAFGVHGIGGIVGALLTGVFASKEISGLDGSVLIQLKGVAVTVIYGFAASFIILKVIDMTVGLRVTEEQEREGLDISLHGESIE